MARVSSACGKKTVLPLPGLKARVFLVDDVYAALAAHDAAVFIAFLGGFQ